MASSRVRLGRPLRAVIFWLYVAMLFGPFLAIFALAFQMPLGGLTFPMARAVADLVQRPHSSPAIDRFQTVDRLLARPRIDRDHPHRQVASDDGLFRVRVFQVRRCSFTVSLGALIAPPCWSVLAWAHLLAAEAADGLVVPGARRCLDLTLARRPGDVFDLPEAQPGL